MRGIMSLGITVAFEKADPSGSYVRGWASVVQVDGEPVTDAQGDRITIEELRKAAHRYISDARVAKAMHSGQAVGEVVESVVVDDATAAALGITDTRRGWWIGMRIDDSAVRKQVASGTLRAFSIGGKGKRKVVSG